MPEVIEALKTTVRTGKGIAVIQASQTLMKIAELESLGDETAPPDINFIDIGTDETGQVKVLEHTTPNQPVCDTGTA